MDYKLTLNLPKTDFPMKADLVKREPERLAQWQAANLDHRVFTKNDAPNARTFILHDGPPFANGDVHIGTALNKILKDIIVKYQSWLGNYTPYVPGWDCHGLPIEFKVSQEMRKSGDSSVDDPAEVRRACAAYAHKFIDIQKAQFRRLGVFGAWDNPYLTLNKAYEAQELRLFAELIDKGLVYRGKKPVYWSIPCKTALAEAEVEYQDHVSQSVYVKFPLVGHQNTFLLIWTTTPWTLPANLAVAYNSTFSYTLVQVENEAYLVSTLLLPAIAEKCGWGPYQIMRSLQAEDLQQIQYKHPFCNRVGQLHAGDTFVENSTGTGFVHIAPGHGQEDYGLGRDKGLPIYSPVDDQGCLAYTSDLPEDQQMPVEMVGKSILAKKGPSEANSVVIETLKASNHLVHLEDYHHSYPHCWRSKTPVIFRAMDQWFVSIDHDGFRQKALNAIQNVHWVPTWGQNRIEGAVTSRPDWCISRQRSWGVPIPAFYDNKGDAFLSSEVVRKVADLVEQHGSNVWFERSVEELWADVKPTSDNIPVPSGKSRDTLDVWIDSGSSSRAVLMQRPELHHRGAADGSVDQWQADIYLEGSDQHRGWFQSSLLLSLGGNGAAPFKTVLTHGFMIDEDRRKISKSRQTEGGYEKPQTADAYVKDYGADIVRLWVASQDYRNDILVSTDRINKVAEIYRLLRNTLRFQLSNLFDFDPASNSVPESEWSGVDQWIWWSYVELDRQVRAAYDAYEFHVVYQRISQFVSVELSSIYHDVVKDRLYTAAANSPIRRSTQTVLHRIVKRLSQLLSPILVFTTDEAWEHLPGRDESQVSIHLSTAEEIHSHFSESQQSTWKRLFKLRETILPHLESARQSKLIGKSTEARIRLTGHSGLEDWTTAKSHSEDLRELLGISVLGFEEDASLETITILAEHADGEKCQRCWRWEDDVGSHPDHTTLCGRCVSAIQ